MKEPSKQTSLIRATYHITNPKAWRQYFKPSAAWLKQVISSVQTIEEGPKEATSIHMLFTSNRTIQKLNAAFRGKDKPTNVLSFPAPSMPTLEEDKHLGDIVVAFETILQESHELERPLEAHLTHMLIHGLLHLLGFDHQEEAERLKMEQKEGTLLQQLGLPNPWTPQN